MTVLHVREQGAVVRRDVEQIRVTRQDKETRKQQLLAHVPVRDLVQIVVYGNVQVTTQAAALLMTERVDLVFMTLYGKFVARLSGSEDQFAQLHQAQMRLSGNEQVALAVAKKIVQAKLLNQRNTLQALAAQLTGQPPAQGAMNAAAIQSLPKAATTIEEMRRASHRASDSDGLRGFEGRAGASYFGAILALLDPRWRFEGRKYHPAPDPFNALLSFGYALLQKDMTAVLRMVGLNPHLGCFHALEAGRPSLTLDLMEEFRPLAVDRLLLDLVRTGALTPTDFTFTGNAERPVELGQALLPKVIEAYEQGMARTLLHRPSGQENTLRRCLELQARLFARVVMGERKEYEGVVA
jgi:CRISP-associated protein Cas1